MIQLDLKLVKESWDQAKWVIQANFKQIQTLLNQQYAKVFTSTGQLKPGVIGPGPNGDVVPQYVANTGVAESPEWNFVDLVLGVTKRLPFVHLAAASTGSVLVGRGAGPAGDFEQITVDSTLKFTGTVLGVNSASSVGKVYKPLVTGEEPPRLVSDGEGNLIMITFTP